MRSYLPTRQRLEELLHYDEYTGILTWKVDRRGTAKKGSVAGTYNDGYLLVGVDGKVYFSHQLIWLLITGKWPREQIDHKNHRKSDNRWVNLREATHGENVKNQKQRCDHNIYSYESATKGRRWTPKITVDGKAKYLGVCDSREEAEGKIMCAYLEHGFHPNHGKLEC